MKILQVALEALEIGWWWIELEMVPFSTVVEEENLRFVSKIV
jgi:hypothetical protein